MSEMTDEVREQSARLYFVDHSPVDEAERELVAVLRLLDAERVRADSCEKMAREANAECIKHWNRADEAESRIRRALVVLDWEIHAPTAFDGIRAALNGQPVEVTR